MNWKVVFISLVSATTFWLIRTLGREHSALVSYPVEFVFDQDSAVVIEPLPEIIQMDVSGGGWDLFLRTLLFTVKPVKVEMDNPADIRYFTRSSLMPIVVEQLQGLRVNYLVSDTLLINVERKMFKEVTIRIDSINLPMIDRHRITSPIRIVPRTVVLSGPESIVSTLQDEYYVMPDINRISSSVDISVGIDLPFENLMRSEPNQVRVQFEVEEFVVVNVPVRLELINFPEDSTVSLSDSTVVISYLTRNELSDEYNDSDFGITLDYNLMELDSTIQPILFFSPENAQDVRFQPESINVVGNE